LATTQECPLYHGYPCPYGIEVVPGRVFVAYPFKSKKVREILTRVKERLADPRYSLSVDFVYADNRIALNAHVLCKICQDIRSSRFCVCDLRGPEYNVNVALESGLALGKGVPIVLIFRKQDRNKLPADLAGLDSFEYTRDKRLEDDLVEKLSSHLAQSVQTAPASPSPAQCGPAFATAFEGKHIDETVWEVGSGEPLMVKQDDGLWVAWETGEYHSGSGNLTLKHPLPSAFCVDTVFRFSQLGIGWDPGIYLYAGPGTDMVLGLNLMPPVPAWNIATTVAVARTPKIPSVVGRLNFNIFDIQPVHPNADISVRLRVENRVARVRIGNSDEVDLPLPSVPRQLTVGAFRWHADPPQQEGTQTRCCIRRLSFDSCPSTAS
jgi:hypothetical protein